MCIGNNFALMEMQLILATVAQRYTLRLVPGHPVEPEAFLSLRPRYGLPMTLYRIKLTSPLFLAQRSVAVSLSSVWFEGRLQLRTWRSEQANGLAGKQAGCSLPVRNLLHGPGPCFTGGCKVEIGKRTQFPNLFGRLKALELLDHEVATRAQGACTALQEIAIRLLIEVMEETTNEDEIKLLVPQIVCQCIPDTVDDALTHSLLCKDLCCVDNGFR
jgi:cytochrome P450